MLGSSRPLWAAIHGSMAGLPAAAKSLFGRRESQPTDGPGEPGSVLVVNPGADLYGSDRMLLESVSGLLEVGRPVAVTLPMQGPLIERLEALGATVIICRTPVIRKSMLNPRGLVRFASDLLAGLRRGPSLIRIYGAGGVYVNTLTNPLWIVMARVLGRPVLCHVHEAEQSMPQPARSVLSCPALLADRVVVNSQFTLNVLTQAIPRVRRRCVVVYNGIDFRAEAVTARGALLGPVTLLVNGRLSPRKGSQVAVASVGELRFRGFDVRLNLLGSVFPGYEWFENELRTMVFKTKMEENVAFLGFDPEVWPHLRACDIALVPSVGNESFGNAVVEAVSAARPLVITAQEGLMEAARGLGSVQCVEPGDAAQLADAVQRIISNWPSYRDQALADAQVVRGRHSISQYRSAIIGIIDSLEQRSGW